MSMPGPVWMMTHGHAVQSQSIGWWEGLEKVGGRDYSDIVGSRRGGGAVFRGKERRAHWFHVAIPTPAHVAEPDNLSVTYRAHLATVGIQFLTSDHQGFLDEVLVYERHRPIFSTTSRGSLRLDGDYRGAWQEGGDGANVFNVPDRPTVWGALGITVKIYFERESDVEFTQFGARFIYQLGG